VPGGIERHLFSFSNKSLYSHGTVCPEEGGVLGKAAA